MNLQTSQLQGRFFLQQMSLFVPGEKQALELQWNNQLFHDPKQIMQDKSETEMDDSDEWLHSQMNVANDAEENRTVDFVMMKTHLNLKHQKFERNPKWKLKPSNSIEKPSQFKDPNCPNKMQSPIPSP